MTGRLVDDLVPGAHDLAVNQKAQVALGLRDGAEGIRTPDPHIANVMLYQLSYSPNMQAAPRGGDTRDSIRRHTANLAHRPPSCKPTLSRGRPGRPATGRGRPVPPWYIGHVKSPTVLILLLAWLARAGAAPLTAVGAELPELDALDALSPARLLGVRSGTAQVLAGELVWAGGADSLPRPTIAWRVVLGPGPGRASLDRPADLDARLGLQVMVLDGGRRALCQVDRKLAWQSCEELPENLEELPRPELLAISAGHALVVADPRAGTVAVRRPGEDWALLLDNARAGLLRPRALEAVGERIFLLDQGGPMPRLLLCGTEGGWLQAWSDPGLAALHREGERDLLLLRREELALVLERWPEAALLQRLPAARRLVVARFAPPTNLELHPPRDFLWLQPPGGGRGQLLLARAGAPALLLEPLDGTP